MKQRGVGVAFLLIAFALSAGGCDVIEKFKQKAKDKADKAASAEPSGPLSSDPDEALGLKLNGPIECINNASGQVSRSRDRYVSWFPDAKAGPTGKEKIVYGLYKVTPTFVERCKKELAGYRKVKEPPTADLDKLADTYEAKLDAVVPLIETAAKYYEAKDYEDDKLAKAKTMHPGLMKAFDEFNDADKALRAELKKLKSGMADRELAKVEKTEGKKLRWNHLKTNMVAEKVVQMGDEDPSKLDAAAFETLLKEYEAQVDA
ncbi:MAG: YiiG family protein, partial [Myxococcales bacterium]|nr:YiiG family protein [Myxococcales bacterium]